MRRAAALCAISLLACMVGAGRAGGTGFSGTAAAVATDLPRAPAAAQNVRLRVRLSPERLGAGTTIEFSTAISAPGGHVPSPLTGLDLRYPAKIGLLTSGLGRANCSTATLETLGERGCPANALMGFGSALLEIQADHVVVKEAGLISIWNGPVFDEQLQLLFYARAVTPANEQLVFGGLLGEADPPFGGSLNTAIPPIPWNPEAPPASISRFTVRIGPKNIVYYRRGGGREIPYHPEGLRLPHLCPRGGFPFAAVFTFMDGTSATTRTSVPCPRR
jgi:hypothetical protein